MRNRIIDLIKKIVGNEAEITVTVPEEEKYGHYSTNVAFHLARARGKPAMEVAEELSENLVRAGREFLEKVWAAPPGFINFWISGEVLREELKKALKEGKNYGKGDLGGSRRPAASAARGKSAGRRIQVEFISANPTGPLTLANGRGGFWGDVLSNVLEWQGYKIEREYYVNDTGNQIITFGKSLVAALGLSPGQPSDEENLYRGSYVKEWAKTHKTIVKKYKGDPLKLGQIAARDFLKVIRKAIEKKSKIKFDRYTSEANHIHKKNFISKTLELFKKAGKIYEKDGAVWLKTTDFGDDKDRVLVTSDGYPTYFLADAGHYLETKTRGFDKKINILGPDHYGYVRRIQAAAKIIGLDSEVMITQAVRLVRGGKEIRMSKRRGEFVTFEELVNKVGADVARFFFLMVAPTTHMDFDLELAKKRSLQNPVYYVEYAFVRAAHILEKAKRNPQSKISLKSLNTEEDLKLIFELARFPEVLEDTAEDYEVHRLTRYARDLAKAFHNFYEKERVIGAEEGASAARLMLVKGATVVFKNLFRVLGVSVPKEM